MTTRQTDLTTETTSWTLKSGAVVTVTATLVKEEWDPAETGNWTLIGTNSGIPYRVVLSASANGQQLANRASLWLCPGHPSGAVASIGKLGISAANIDKVNDIAAKCEAYPEHVAYLERVAQGLTVPAGASPICLRGYCEAEQEMMRADAPKPMRTIVEIKHLFGGEATGRVTRHRVRGADGLYRLMARESGDGWGVQAWLTKAAAKRLGVRVVDADTVLACKASPVGAISVSVYGHDYNDPSATAL